MSVVHCGCVDTRVTGTVRDHAPLGSIRNIMQVFGSNNEGAGATLPRPLCVLPLLITLGPWNVCYGYCRL